VVAAGDAVGRPRVNEDPVDVLVVGAGPAGLALALQAHTDGARVRIVEQRPELFRPSRAIIRSTSSSIC